jgi:hypothetical protein
MWDTWRDRFLYWTGYHLWDRMLCLLGWHLWEKGPFIQVEEYHPLFKGSYRTRSRECRCGKVQKWFPGYGWEEGYWEAVTSGISTTGCTQPAGGSPGASSPSS